MNEDFNIEALEVLNKALEDPNQDGTQILATLFALPDEEFEILRPALQDALQAAYAEPQTQLQMIQLCNQNGINIYLVVLFITCTIRVSLDIQILT